MKKILICVGTRPNFIKITQFKKKAAEYNLEVKVLHTGQHFDHKMSAVFFEELNLDKPDIFLNAKGNSQIELMADIMVKFETILNEFTPQLVLVPGDVNSSIACAFTASRNKIPIGHIESGLRSFDHEMPEEVNRILIDNLSDFLFVTEQSGYDNLIKEGKHKSKIHFVGNTMIDSLVSFRNKINQSNILKNISCPPEFGLMTFHRPSNVDNKKTLNEILNTISLCTKELTIVLPLHPRTKKSLVSNGLFDKLNSLSGLILTDSLGYIDFMKLVTNSKIVITDSGGIQEETTFLKIPCLTVRKNTERPISLTLGTNDLIELDSKKIASKMLEKLKQKKKSSIPPLWDGYATKRILEIISQKL